VVRIPFGGGQPTVLVFKKKIAGDTHPTRSPGKQAPTDRRARWSVRHFFPPVQASPFKIKLSYVGEFHNLVDVKKLIHSDKIGRGVIHGNVGLLFKEVGRPKGWGEFESAVAKFPF